MMPRREPSASAPKESAPKENKPKPPTGPMLKFASDARAHMEKYGTTIDQLAQVSVKQHYNAARNPYAQYQEEVTLAQVHAAREVAAPLTVLHCCPFGDGAAAVLLCDLPLGKAARELLHGEPRPRGGDRGGAPPRARRDRGAAQALARVRRAQGAP